jgi:hypothetical protein
VLLYRVLDKVESQKGYQKGRQKEGNPNRKRRSRLGSVDSQSYKRKVDSVAEPKNAPMLAKNAGWSMIVNPPVVATVGEKVAKLSFSGVGTEDNGCRVAMISAQRMVEFQW